MPGVGAFGAVMAGLLAARGPELIERRLAGGRPVLGICVGMQVLFERGVEGDGEREGLGEWPGTVDRLDAPVLPHMGWNEVRVPTGSRLFAGIETERFYFVHSYGGARVDDAARTRAARRRWSPGPTTAAPSSPPSRTGRSSATQFHPEKSGDAGLRLLANWLETL